MLENRSPRQRFDEFLRMRCDTFGQKLARLPLWFQRGCGDFQLLDAVFHT